MNDRGMTSATEVLHRVDHDMEAETSVCESVVDALARVEDAEPEALASPVHDAIDLDALDRLFSSRFDGTPRSTTGYVEFTARDCRVVVHSDGEILVYRDETV